MTILLIPIVREIWNPFNSSRKCDTSWTCQAQPSCIISTVSTTVTSAEQALFSLHEISQFPFFSQSVSLILHGSGRGSCWGVIITRRCNPRLWQGVCWGFTLCSITPGLSSDLAAPTAALPALPTPNPASGWKNKNFSQWQKIRICYECKGFSPNRTVSSWKPLTATVVKTSKKC